MPRFLPAILLVGFFIILAFFLEVLPRQSPFTLADELSSAVTRPIIQAGPPSRSLLGKVREYFRSRQALKRENQLLKERQQALLARIAELKNAGQENEFLRTALKIKVAPASLVMARVMGRSLDLSGQKFVIDQGFKTGLAVDAPVLGPHGFLVGRLTRVSRSRSIFGALNDPDVVLAGITQDSRGRGVIRGTLDGNIIMTEISAPVQPRVGEMVITIGANGVIPPNLPVGTVESIEQLPNQTTKSVLIKPLTPFGDLTQVLIPVL